jgi:hypothetical protein
MNCLGSSGAEHEEMSLISEKPDGDVPGLGIRCFLSTVTINVVACYVKKKAKSVVLNNTKTGPVESIYIW